MPPSFPNTALAVGQVDAPFGGQAANRLGTAMLQYRDGQMLEAERQLVDLRWSGRPAQMLAITDGGLAGDAIVFDTQAVSVDGSPIYRPLKNITWTPDAYPIVGVLLSPVSAAQVGPLCPGGGHLTQAVTGLARGAAGPATIDTATGRLRLRVAGETTRGFIDSSGNCYVLPLGTSP